MTSHHDFTEQPFRLLLPAILFVLVLFTSGFIASHYTQDGPPGGPKLVMPVEVWGEGSHEQSITSIRVVLANGAGPDSLYVQIHNPAYRKSEYADRHGYDSKASVRVNGGRWIDIDNDNFVCQYPDNLYVIDPNVNQGRRGCIGGPLQTVRGRIAIDDFRNGNNTIEFRFNGTDGRTGGYRILDLDVFSGNTSRLRTRIENDDPSEWTPYYTDAEALREGQRLFEERNSIDRSPRHNQQLIASCADCHAADGRDLWYFNYSNESIVSRSEFHGLTREEGKKIASWIRALPELDETISVPSGYTEADLGRPWNPPYQPGPGLREKPVELWAAGAGLEWVLDDEREAPGTERDMVTHLFPEGTTGEAAFQRVHPDSALNVDEIPIAHQLPDWNNWLPEVHPFDWWGSESTVTGSNMYKAYKNIHEDFSGNIESLIEGAATSSIFHRGLRQHFVRFDVQYWNDDTLSDPPSRDFDFDAIAKLSYFQWNTLKHWEIVQRYGLEDRFDDIFPGAGNERGWPQMIKSLYFVAPHMNSRPAYPSTAPYADPNQNIYFSTAWYELQLMLNPGAKLSRGGAPFDWNYHGPHVLGTGNRYSHPQALRYFQSQIVVKQQRNTFTEERFGRWSWELKQVTPAKDFYGPSQGYYRFHFEESLDQGLRRDIVELLLRSFMEKTLRHDASEWPRRTADDEGHRDKPEHESFVPEPYRDPHGRIGGYEFRQNDHANSFFRYLNRVQQLGVDPELIDKTARWGKEMWPKGDWEQYYDDGAGRLEVAIVDPETGSSLNGESDIVIKADVSASKGSIDRVAFVVNGSTLYETKSEPYVFEWSDVAEGIYEIRVQAHDDAGNVGYSSPVRISVGVDKDVQQIDQVIALRPGWNMVSSFAVPDNTPIEEVFDDVAEAIEMVKDADGKVYSSYFGINEIGKWQRDQAYMVLTQENAILAVDGNGAAPSYHSVSLNEGWNYLPFLAETPRATQETLQDLLRDVVLVKDLYGNVFFPEQRLDTIEKLEPGRGYQVYMRRDRELEYDTSDQDEGISPPLATSTSVGGTATAGPAPANGRPASPESAVLVLQARGISDGTVITAWTAEDHPVGSATVQDGIGVLVLAGDEPYSEIVEGARQEQPISLRATYDGGDRDVDLDVERVSDYLTGEHLGSELIYASNAIWAARVSEAPVVSLESNYPNPFRRTTTIPYVVRDEVHVRIKVFDILGRRLQVLVDEEQAAGAYAVELDGSMLPSGVYFYRIEAGSHEETGRMVLTR